MLVVDGALVTGVPPGGVPVAVALLSTLPAVSSAVGDRVGHRTAARGSAHRHGGRRAGNGVAESLRSFTTTRVQRHVAVLVTANE